MGWHAWAVSRTQGRVAAAVAVSILAVAGAIFVTLLVESQRRQGDSQAWSQLQTYASTQGPALVGELYRSDPCVFVEDEGGSGDAALESSLHAATMADFEARAEEAATLLQSQGWRDIGLDTAATKTYLTAERMFAERMVFVAVESSSATDLGQVRAEYRVRYLLTVKGC